MKLVPAKDNDPLSDLGPFGRSWWILAGMVVSFLLVVLVVAIFIDVSRWGIAHAWGALIFPFLLFLAFFFACYLLLLSFWAGPKLLATRLRLKGHSGELVLVSSLGAQAKVVIQEGLELPTSIRLPIAIVMIADRVGLSFWARSAKAPIREISWQEVRSLEVGTINIYPTPVSVLELDLNGATERLWMSLFRLAPLSFGNVLQKGVERTKERILQYRYTSIGSDQTFHQVDHGSGDAGFSGASVPISEIEPTNRPTLTGKILGTAGWALLSALATGLAMPLAVNVARHFGWLMDSNVGNESVWWTPSILFPLLMLIFGLVSGMLILRSLFPKIWAVPLACIWAVLGYSLGLSMFFSNPGGPFESVITSLQFLTSTGLIAIMIGLPILLALVLRRRLF